MSKNMSKKNKNQNRNTPRADIFAPQMVDMDSLAYLSDLELDRRRSYLDEDKMKAIHSGVDPYAWEVELAYLQREFDIRRTRRSMHEQYLRSNPELYINDYSDTSGTDNYIN